MMETRIANLKVGDRFRMDDQVGTLLYVNACRALVQLETPPRQIEIQDKRSGKVRTFTSKKGKQISWPLDVPVVKLDVQPQPQAPPITPAPSPAPMQPHRPTAQGTLWHFHANDPDCPESQEPSCSACGSWRFLAIAKCQGFTDPEETKVCGNEFVYSSACWDGETFQPTGKRRDCGICHFPDNDEFTYECAECRAPAPTLTRCCEEFDCICDRGEPN